ncbi:MAG: hypothetical protein Q8R28_08885 [Dehalococcoidia bacterium]|nr:hypothetical protein [Dehalococcoidia bacterium]
MKPGDRERLQGPSWEFTLPVKNRRLSFLTGGIGITPMLSMLRYVTDKGLPFVDVPVYGNATSQVICFREELEAIALASPLIRVVHHMATPSLDWKAPTGRIKAEPVREFIPDYGERLFYVSGPPSMAHSLEDRLLSMGLPSDRSSGTRSPVTSEGDPKRKEAGRHLHPLDAWATASLGGWTSTTSLRATLC